MELNYENLKNELLHFLDANNIWTLATSDGNRVSARSMSIVHEKTDIYFQTNRHFDKYNQIMKNRNAALCCSNVSIEGAASDIGTWEENPAVKEIYIKHHKGSFEAYSRMPGQVVIRIVPHYAVFWKYIEGQPVRDFLYIADKRAERLYYFEQYPEK